MRIIRANTCKTTSWKNGGGSTTEIVVEPPDASLETFDWRISMARVSSDGPFSEFAGIDRTLAVIHGDGLVLTIDNKAPVTSGRGSDPIEFAGDAGTSAQLMAGEIIDLNVMTRRSRFSHRLTCVRETRLCDFDNNDLAVVFAFDGRAAVTSGHELARLDHGDAAVLMRSEHASFQIEPTSDGDCYLMLLRERDGQPG